MNFSNLEVAISHYMARGFEVRICKDWGVVMTSIKPEDVNKVVVIKGSTNSIAIVTTFEG